MKEKNQWGGLVNEGEKRCHRDTLGGTSWWQWLLVCMVSAECGHRSTTGFQVLDLVALYVLS